MTMSPPGLALGSSVSSANATEPSPSISASADAATVDARNLFISCSLSLLLSEFDAWIDEGRDDVGQKVAEHDGERRHQRHAHDDRNIDALDRLPGKLADARPAEHALHHDDTAHEDADIDADHGDDRQDGVGQRMAKKNRAARQPFGAGGAHIILPQHVDHGGAHHARVPAGAEDAHGERW